MTESMWRNTFSDSRFFYQFFDDDEYNHSRHGRTSAVKENGLHIFANFIVCSYVIDVVQNKICSVISKRNVSHFLPFPSTFIKFSLKLTSEILSSINSETLRPQPYNTSMMQ